MKTLADLEAIREKMKGKVAVRDAADNSTRIVVGMATCGIAAGARPVLNALVEEVNKANLTESVTVTQTGCIGMCQLEPIVEVYMGSNEKVTYVKMDAEKAKRIVAEHIKKGNVVTEYTVGKNKA